MTKNDDENKDNDEDNDDNSCDNRIHFFVGRWHLLDAPSHLYNRVCPSVLPSVRALVRPSPVIFEGGKNAY